MKEYSEELIQEIRDRIDLVDYISDYVELKQKNQDWFGLCPFHNEETASFCVTPSKKMFYCFGCGCGGDILVFCMKYFGISYVESVKRLSKYIGIDAKMVEVSSTVKFLREVKKANEHKKLPAPHNIIDQRILSTYHYEDVKEWISEGIPQEIMQGYGVGYDKQRNSKNDRIIYPVYDYDGNLINIKGRTLCKTYKAEKIPKYINYFAVGDLDYFQGLNFKKDIVKEKGEIIIFESFKSVMKADSFGFENSVSSETSKINYYQLQILIKLHVDVVIAFDADIPLKDIKTDDKISILSKFTNVYVVYDKSGLLGDRNLKNAPVDCGREKWVKLYNQRIRYK